MKLTRRQLVSGGAVTAVFAIIAKLQDDKKRYEACIEVSRKMIGRRLTEYEEFQAQQRCQGKERR